MAESSQRADPGSLLRPMRHGPSPIRSHRIGDWGTGAVGFQGFSKDFPRISKDFSKDFPRISKMKGGEPMKLFTSRADMY